MRLIAHCGIGLFRDFSIFGAQDAADEARHVKKHHGDANLAAAKLAAYQAALAEERRLWRDVGDPGLSATHRLMAYARWLAAAERVKLLEPGQEKPKG